MPLPLTVYLPRLLWLLGVDDGRESVIVEKAAQATSAEALVCVPLRRQGLYSRNFTNMQASSSAPSAFESVKTNFGPQFPHLQR